MGICSICSANGRRVMRNAAASWWKTPRGFMGFEHFQAKWNHLA
jgi:hypothetical protein